jgi:hypothetical protein
MSSGIPDPAAGLKRLPGAAAGFEDALKFMNKLYNEGLISKDLLAYNEALSS